MGATVNIVTLLTDRCKWCRYTSHTWWQYRHLEAVIRGCHGLTNVYYLTFTATINALSSVGLTPPDPGTMQRGHYKGAKNIHYAQYLDENTNCFKTSAELEQCKQREQNTRIVLVVSNCYGGHSHTHSPHCSNTSVKNGTSSTIMLPL